jgi:hypothetical protein
VLSTLQLTGAAEPGARVLAAGDVQPSSTTAAGDGSFTLALEPTVGEGALEVELTVEDAAGNRSRPAYLAVELDCTAPRVTASDWDGATTVSVRYSETLDPDTVSAGGSATLDGTFGPLPFTVEVARAVVTLELAETPAADELPLRLVLSSEIRDTAGNPAVPYQQLFAEPGAATFVAGEVFADRTSLEVAGARPDRRWSDRRSRSASRPTATCPPGAERWGCLVPPWCSSTSASVSRPRPSTSPARRS